MHEPCMIPEACKDLGRFTGRYRACYMHGLLPIFHAWSMHVPCMESGPHFMHIPCVVLASSMHGTGEFHAWYRRIPCMVQAYSMHGTCVFYVWYRHILCVVQAYSMRGTGMYLPCMVHVFPCMHHV